MPSECVAVAGKSSRAHGGGSPGKRQHLESCGGSNQMHSPSNYCTTTGKPDQHKKLESPFQLKQRKGSKKSLLKRLLGSTVSSPDENPGCITIGLGQTLTLSERTGRDSVSILSLESAERGREGCTADERGSEERTAIERGREGCAADERGRSTAVSRTLSYGEISGIESGDKVFDVTSPDHCVVVDVDTPPSPLEDTVLSPLEDTPPSPLEDTVLSPLEDTVLSPLENTVPSPLKDTALSPPVKDTSYSLVVLINSFKYQPYFAVRIQNCMIGNHVISGHVISVHVVSGHVVSGHVISGHVVSGHVISGHVISVLVVNGHVINGHVISGHVVSGHVISGHVVSGHVISVHVVM